MRFLNGIYGIEVIYGRLNLSSADVEKYTSTNTNVSYVKKIGNRAVVSAQCQKKGMMEYMSKIGKLNIASRIKEKNSVITPANPAVYANEDLFGFTRLESEKITENMYNDLPDCGKLGFKKGSKSKKGEVMYNRNITKKRKAKMLLSPLVEVTGSVVKEFNTSTTSSNSMLYQTEAYNGVMTGICNLDIENASKFTVSSIASEFRDYSPEEISEDKIELSRDERLYRIQMCLEALEYLKIPGNQTNCLTDTSLKFVILGEFSWGNNVFQGVINKNGLNIEALAETIDDNKKFQISPIWIAVSDQLRTSKIKESFQITENTIKEYNLGAKHPIVICDSVGDAFNKYLEYLKKTYK